MLWTRPLRVAPVAALLLAGALIFGGPALAQDDLTDELIPIVDPKTGSITQGSQTKIDAKLRQLEKVMDPTDFAELEADLKEAADDETRAIQDSLIEQYNSARELATRSTSTANGRTPTAARVSP